MKRMLTWIVLSVLVFSTALSVASAGGWAVITLDALPTGVVVDTPVTVGMVVRQHGKTPMTNANVVVRGFQLTGDKFEVRAKHDGQGHYSAELTFNKAGTWQWQVSSGLYPEWQKMPDIRVANSAEDEALLAKANTGNTAAAPNLQAMAPSLWLLALGVLGLVGCSGGLVYWLRARRIG